MNDKSIYGLKAIFNKDTFAGMCKDCIWPSIISIAITSWLLIKDIDLYPLMTKVWDISINVIPIIVTLLVTAYTILISVLNGLKDIVKGGEIGENLLDGLNNSFASSIILSVLFLGLLFVYFIVGKMELESDYANIINAIGLFTTIVFITYPFVSLINIVIDIFNSEKLQLHIWSTKVNAEDGKQK